MHIEFWFDPACPYCWRTSRWLVDVAPQRSLEIEWRTISLLEKNGGLDKVPEKFRDSLVASHGMLRVAERLRSDGNLDVGRFYTEIGTQIHHDSVKPVDVDLRTVLRALGLEPDIADAADDPTLDVAITESMRAGLSQTGDDVGTPIVAFEGAGAYFGPVVDPIPTGTAALDLFDAVHTLATTPGMWELKRSRNAGSLSPLTVRPDTAVPPTPVAAL